MNIQITINNMRRPRSPTIAHFDKSDYSSQFNRKRQRRQVAGAVVQGLVGGNGPAPGLTPSGRKSTAQPRPKLQIPPRGIGPIAEPNNNDGKQIASRQFSAMFIASIRSYGIRTNISLVQQCSAVEVEELTRIPGIFSSEIWCKPGRRSTLLRPRRN